MAPSSFYLCICDECSKETSPARGNHQTKESVCGRYWKKNSATHKQHMQELRQNIIRGGNIPSNSADVHTQNIPNAGHSPQCQESAVKPTQCQESAQEGSAVSNLKRGLLRLPAQILGAILLAVCQYLFFHLSLVQSNNTLQVLKQITALDKSNPKYKSDFQFPVDMRTIISHLGIASQIHRRLCCPKCFCLYPMDNKLSNCSFRATPKSHVCQASLSISSHRKGDKSNSNPSEFAFQSLFEWLGMFLNRPGIEDELEKSINHVSAADAMEDIWDSPRWKEYTDSEGRQFTRRSGNLVFSLNVDWFNPCGNKIAGKHWSVGTVAMTCLNLSPTLRNRPENIFLAALIPGPSEPKLDQMNHVLQPLVSDLLSLWTGRLICPTINSPVLGRMIRVRLGPVICDLPAIRKVLGLAGHSSKYHLCQFCHVNKDTLDIVDIDRLDPRSDKDVRYHCLRWKKARKVSKREQIFKRHGVRYSVLLKLPYFNLLDDAVVEPLHNVFLGLLHNHGTEFFGLKKHENKVDYDSEESDRLERQDTMIGVEYNGDEDTISISSGENDGSPSPDPVTGPPLGDNADINLEIMRCFEAFEDLSLHDPTTRSNNIRKQTIASHDPKANCHSDVYEYTQVEELLFSIPENLQLLRAVIDEIRLPSNIGRVPRTVGQPKGGKLKAEEWINLFSIILIPTFFLIMKSDSCNHHEDLNSQLFNLLSLVSISNIVRQNRVRSEDIQNLQAHLKTYRQGILRLYPWFSTKPNHHLALHLPECISRLGPAPYWTGWVFERLNGSLAALPTNQRISQLNSTLLNKWTTSQNFCSIYLGFCDQLPSQLAEKITQLMNPSKAPITPERSRSDNNSGLPCNQYNPQFSKSKNLNPEHHLRLLKRLVEIEGHDLVGPEDLFKNWQKPKNPCPVLTRLINYDSNMSFGNFVLTTKEKHPGNSTIHYRYQYSRNRSKLCYGQILEIFSVSYQHELDGPFVVETWLDVASFDELSPADRKLNLLIDWPYAHTHVTYQKQTARHFVKPEEVLTQTTVWGAPCGTLGIRSPINILTEIKNHTCW